MLAVMAFMATWWLLHFLEAFSLFRGRKSICLLLKHCFYKGSHRISVAISIFICKTTSAPVVSGRDLWLTNKMSAESIQVSSAVMDKDVKAKRKVTRDGLE